MSHDLTPALDRLRGLARAVAFDGRLDVVLGERGSGWSLDARSGRIHVDPDDLEGAHPDDVRSLVCHEAAHWAVTRYPSLLPRSVLRTPGVAPLLNALEDCRIETWLGRRFPGTAAWIRRTNDRLLPVSLAELPAQSLAHQYCLGAILEWWREEEVLPASMDVDVVEALRNTREARRRAVELQPPVSVLEADGAAYAGSVLATRFAALDARRPPDAFERSVRLSAWSWWELVHQEIFPAYEPLVARDRAERADVVEEEERFVRRLRGLTHGGFGERSPLRPASTGEGTSTARAPLRPTVADAPDAYETARRRVAGLVERTTQALLPLVTRGRQPHWGGSYPHGGRVDLRRVMQAQADPRRRERLWQRKSLPDRRDPVVSLLLDLSGSMSGDRIARAFDAVVLLVEVLHRLDIPCAVAGFQDRRLPVKEPHEPLDAAVRARLGALPLEASGRRRGGHNRPEHNHDGPVLLEAAGRLLQHPAPERWLWVLSDGLPTGPGDGVGPLHRAVTRVVEDGAIHVVGIGMGPGTEHVQAFYPEALPAVPLDALPEALGNLVARRVVGSL